MSGGRTLKAAGKAILNGAVPAAEILVVSAANQASCSIASSSGVKKLAIDNDGSKTVESLPRVVFDGAPTTQEVTHAISDIEDTFVRNDQLQGERNLSPPWNSAIVPFSENLSNGTLVTRITSIPVVQAWRLISQNASFRAVITSLALDPSVMNAVRENRMFQSLQLTQIAGTTVQANNFSNQSPPGRQSNPGSGRSYTDYIKDINHLITEMITKFSSAALASFSGGSMNVQPVNPDVTVELLMEDAQMENTLISLLIKCAMMVIMVVLLKRAAT